MDFWNRVEEELNFQGKTKKELAIITGIKEHTLHKGFERKSSPSADTALKNAKVLNVSIEYLITGKDPEKAQTDMRIDTEIKAMITKMNKFSPEEKKVIFDMVDVLSKK